MTGFKVQRYGTASSSLNSFEALNEVLVGRCQTKKKLANNTYAIRRDADTIAIRLHDTDVVTHNRDGSVVLNSGGYKTPTTKDRINTFSPVQLWQRKDFWSFSTGAGSFTFTDGVKINSDGSVTGAMSKTEIEAQTKLVKQINKYGQSIADALPLQKPSGGDCWHCCGISDSTDHYLEHMREGYLVPRLVWNALLHARCNPQGNGSFWFAKAFGEKTTIGDSAQIKRFVVKFLKQKFGIA